MFRPIDFTNEYLDKYWEGPNNSFARIYTYLQRGFGLVNEAKNYFFIVFGTYWTIKTMDLWIKYGYSDAILAMGLGIITVVGIGVLVVIGRWEFYRLAKAREYATQMISTVTGYNAYNMQVEQVRLLREINGKLQRYQGTNKRGVRSPRRRPKGCKQTRDHAFRGRV